jgi:hypothetical protein
MKTSAPAASAAAPVQESGGATDGSGAGSINDRFAGLAPVSESASPVSAAEPVKAADESGMAASEPPKAEPVAPARPAKRPVQKTRQKPVDYAARNRNAPSFPFLGFGSLFGQRRG